MSRRHSKFLAWGDLKGPPKYTRAVRIVRDFAEHGDSILALVGRRGTGKSQLATVAVWQTIESGRSAKIVPAIELLGDLKRRFGDDGDAEGDWLSEWSRPHLLVVDEVGELVAGDHSHALLTALLDRRYRDCSPTMLVGNLTAEQFGACVGGSIADRCSEGAGLVVCDGWPSFRRPGGQLSAKPAGGRGVGAGIQGSGGARVGMKGI